MRMPSTPRFRGVSSVIAACLAVAGLVMAVLAAVRPAAAQPMDPSMEVYYTVERSTTLYHAADSSSPYLNLRFREPVYVIENGGEWAHVRTVDGANGIVKYGHLSNIWIRIAKSEQTLYVYRGPELLASYPTDLGYNFFSDKVKRGSRAEPDHWRTPTGRFHVVSKNASSEFYKALVLNYPNREDAERGMRDGIISEEQYDAIVRAEDSIAMPPMNTGLGGWIEIHGDGTGSRRNWTQGCIAITNAQMDRIWNWVDVGTPVLVEP